MKVTHGLCIIYFIYSGQICFCQFSFNPQNPTSDPFSICGDCWQTPILWIHQFLSKSRNNKSFSVTCSLFCFVFKQWNLLIDVQICCILSFYFYNLYMMGRVHFCFETFIGGVCMWMVCLNASCSLENKIKTTSQTKSISLIYTGRQYSI